MRNYEWWILLYRIEMQLKILHGVRWGERILLIHVEKKEEEKKEGWNIIEDSPPHNFYLNFVLH